MIDTSIVKIQIPCGDADRMAEEAGRITAGHGGELDLDTGVLKVRVPVDQITSFIGFVRERFMVEFPD